MPLRDYLRFRYSLRTLMLMVMLVAFGISLWQGYEYMAIPYREAAIESQIRARMPPPQRPFLEIGDRMVNGRYETYVAHGPLSGPTPFSDPERPPDHPLGYTWSFAGRRPITGIFIWDGDITDLDSTIFTTCTHLTHVKIFAGDWNTKITDAQLNDLLSVPTLRSLRLYGVPLTARHIAILSQNQNLTELTLVGADLTDEEIVPLRALVRLESLELSRNPLEYEGLHAVLPRLTSLRHLELDRCPIRDEVCGDIAPLPIRKLSLRTTPLSDAAIEMLATNASIKEFKLDSDRLTDHSLEFLGELRSLRYLNVIGVPFSEGKVDAFKRDRKEMRVEWHPGYY